MAASAESYWPFFARHPDRLPPRDRSRCRSVWRVGIAAGPDPTPGRCSSARPSDRVGNEPNGSSSMDQAGLLHGFLIPAHSPEQQRIPGSGRCVAGIEVQPPKQLSLRPRPVSLPPESHGERDMGIGRFRDRAQSRARPPPVRAASASLRSDGRAAKLVRYASAGRSTRRHV